MTYDFFIRFLGQIPTKQGLIVATLLGVKHFDVGCTEH
jgi:hypothetical protein